MEDKDFQKKNLESIYSDASLALIFNDYRLLSKMNAPLSTKVQMLKQLFKLYPNRWRIVGITKSALQILKDNNFIYKKGMKIQRSHKKNCHEIYSKMFIEPFENSDKWWKYYIKNDETILSLSSENKSISTNKFILPIDQSLELFKDKGYVWTHKDKEIKYLKELYIKHIEKNI